MPEEFVHDWVSRSREHCVLIYTRTIDGKKYPIAHVRAPMTIAPLSTDTYIPRSILVELGIPNLPKFDSRRQKEKVVDVPTINIKVTKWHTWAEDGRLMDAVLDKACKQVWMVKDDESSFGIVTGSWGLWDGMVDPPGREPKGSYACKGRRNKKHWSAQEIRSSA